MPDTIKNGSLTLICADLDARPLFWTDADGQRFGYEPQIAQSVANHMGLELRWHFCRWSDFTSQLMAGHADAIWCGSAITPERCKQFLYTQPYAVFNESVLVRSGDAIANTGDLRGLRVGAINSSTNMALAENWDGCELIGFDGTSDDVFKEMIEALSCGNVDAVVDDEPAFGGVLANAEFKIAFTVKTLNRWGAAMRLGSTDVKVAIDDALKIVIENGEHADIWKQFLGHIEYPQQQ